jgi:hypothetical protein
MGTNGDIGDRADTGTEKNKKKREVIFTRAEKYVKEYRDAEVRSQRHFEG